VIPDNRAFNGGETFEENGKTFYRSYKIEKNGTFELKVTIVSIDSMYRQAIAFNLSSKPKFKGTLVINGEKFTPPKKQQFYVMPVAFPNKTEITMDFDIFEGYVSISNASDFLDDYPELIGKISAQTGRTREQFRGCSYTSGFTAGYLYGNAFWMEQISNTQYRFHCNDHKLDDDFNDLVFDLEVRDK
jgi:hypothetical protein